MEQISVIIPCYNYGRFLAEAVASIRESEDVQIEIIIVDDCSTDNTLAFCADIALEHDNVEVLSLSKNLGKSVAINTGIMASHGQYITILDADDMREPGSLTRMLRVLELNKHSFVYDDMVIYVNGQKGKVWKFPEYDFVSLLENNTIHAGIMFERDAFEATGGYPPEFNTGREDWAFNILLGTKGYCGIHVPNAGYIYRRGEHNRTLTNTTPEWREFFKNQIRKRFSDLYAGRFPMGCCGQRYSHSGTQNNNTPEIEKLVGSEGMSAIEYIGGNYGTQSFYGNVTGTGYKFDAAKRVKMVDNRDLGHFLDLREHTRALFRLAQEQPEIVPATVTRELVLLSSKIKTGTANYKKLTDAGFSTVDDVLNNSAETIAEKTGISVEAITKLKGLLSGK